MAVAARARPVLAYPKGDAVYLNLTNRCPTACVFCLKRPRAWDFQGRDLRLGAREASAAAVVEAASRLIEETGAREAVFCGYGESTYRLDAMREIALSLKRRFPGLKIRLNTIGLGDLIAGRALAPELSEYLDAVSVSLNTADPRQWERLHAPSREFAARGYPAVLRFVKDCADAGLETTVTAVRIPGVRLAAVRHLSRALGARFRIRPLLG